MTAASLIYLEFSFRYPDDERHDGPSIALPVTYAWQEGPEDLHIQLNTPSGRDHLNVFPEFPSERGDYILPYAPCLGKKKDLLIVPDYKWRPSHRNPEEVHPAVVACHMSWRATPSDEEIVASAKYLQLVESLWNSPNR